MSTTVDVCTRYQHRGIQAPEGVFRTEAQLLFCTKPCAVPAIPEPLINEKANLNKVVVADTYLYDLPTKAGQEYILTGK